MGHLPRGTLGGRRLLPLLGLFVLLKVGSPSPRRWGSIPPWGAIRSGCGDQAESASRTRFVLRAVPGGLRSCGWKDLEV